MLKDTIQIGDSRIRARNKNINQKDIKSKKIRTLIKDLTDSMRYNSLVGMAAPQIGVNLNLFVSEIRSTKYRAKNLKEKDGLRVFINPKILSRSKKVKDMVEGCGSVSYGSIHGPVKRHLEILITAFNEEGEKFKLKATGLLAHILQHEYDHLQGVLCIDKFTDTKKVFYRG